MLGAPAFKGSVKIKNVSGVPYTVEEVDQIVADQAELELMDYYDDWKAANRLVTQTTTAKLYADIQAGDVTVVANLPPIG